MDSETEEMQNMDGVALFDQGFEYAWHIMLNLKYTPDSSRGADTFANHEKRHRDDSNPWNVAWPSDSHCRLEMLGNSKVVIN